MNYRSLKLYLGLFLLSLWSTPSFAAELNAYVNHNIVQMGQEIVLSVKLDGKAKGEPDFSALRQDFNILGRPSESSQTQIINGSISSSKTWNILITPKKDGALVIPPVSVGNLSTAPITVVVGKAPSKQFAEAYFETSISSESIYVQAQLKFDLKLYIKMGNISNSQLDPLDIPDSQIIPLGEARQSETSINGIRYYLVERSYFIFPEKSGVLNIPSLGFKAVISEGSRFSQNSRRRHIQAKSDPLQVTVKPIPSSYPAGATWLPAKQVMLAERYTPGEQVEIGEPITRSIISKAVGLPSSALPPVQLKDIMGLKVYPDQGNAEDQLSLDHLNGIRTDSFALIAGQEGKISIPEYKLPWWDTVNDQLRYATLEHKILEFLPSQGANSPLSSDRDLEPITRDKGRREVSTPSELNSKTIILILGGFAVIWLLTILGFWVYIKKLKQQLTQEKDKENSPSAASPKAIAIRSVFKENDLSKLRIQILRWANTQFEPNTFAGLVELGRFLDQPDIQAELNKIDTTLYTDTDASEDIDLKSLEKQLELCAKNHTSLTPPPEKGTALKKLYQD